MHLPSPTVTTDSGSPDHRIPSTPRRTRRWRLVAPLVAIALVAVMTAACAPGSPGSGATGDMVSAINADRAASGEAPLAWDDQLYGLAQNHANEIAASGTLWHS